MGYSALKEKSANHVTETVQRQCATGVKNLNITNL
jgi:hypothetical protein